MHLASCAAHNWNTLCSKLNFDHLHTSFQNPMSVRGWCARQLLMPTTSTTCTRVWAHRRARWIWKVNDNYECKQWTLCNGECISSKLASDISFISRKLMHSHIRAHTQRERDVSRVTETERDGDNVMLQCYTHVNASRGKHGLRAYCQHLKQQQTRNMHRQKRWKKMNK